MFERVKTKTESSQIENHSESSTEDLKSNQNRLNLDNQKNQNANKLFYHQFFNPTPNSMPFVNQFSAPFISNTQTNEVKKTCNGIAELFF